MGSRPPGRTSLPLLSLGITEPLPYSFSNPDDPRSSQVRSQPHSTPWLRFAHVRRHVWDSQHHRGPGPMMCPDARLRCPCHSPAGAGGGSRGAREPVRAGRASVSLAPRGWWSQWEFIPGMRDRALGDALERSRGCPERQHGVLQFLLPNICFLSRTCLLHVILSSSSSGPCQTQHPVCVNSTDISRAFQNKYQ